jgi:putative ABC transport system substrate-binding protein
LEVPFDGGPTVPILSRRRLLVVAAIWPHVGIGQPRTGARRLVFLSVAPVEQAAQPFADAFYEQLARLGWERGHNLLVEGRYGAGDPARAELLARELLDFQPDVLVAGTDDAARAAARVAPTLPIVFINGYDPIGNGLVASLALPGAHATGILVQGPQVSAKRLALLKEAMPDLERPPCSSIAMPTHRCARGSSSSKRRAASSASS